MGNVLPPNSTALERDLQATMASTAALPIAIRDLYNPDTCLKSLLPWLAWSESVDFWDENWTEAQKRGASKAAFEVHQNKGTVYALSQSVKSVGFPVEIIDWRNDVPRGVPYTFRLHVTIEQEGFKNAASYNNVSALANHAKNTRSHMSGLSVSAGSQCQQHVGAAATAQVRIHLEAEPG